MTATVAVTGATGFVGGHVVRALIEAGSSVRILARRLPARLWHADSAVETVIGNLDDEASLRRLVRGCAAVVHAAGLVKARSRAEFFRVNRDGVAPLASLASAEGVPRFVLLSSLAAREPHLSDYAASKEAGEQALAKLSGGRLNWTVLRPPAIYGPGDPETFGFFRAVAHGIGPILGPPEGRLSLVHVRDAAKAVTAAIASFEAVSGAIYEIGDGTPAGHSWPEMVETAGRLLGTRPRLVRVPHSALAGLAAGNRVASLLSGRPRMLTPGKVREIRHPDWVGRDRRFVEATAWQATIGLEEGFSDAIAWYREAGWL